MSILSDTVDRIAPQDTDWRAKARARLEQLTMPRWALGRLMDTAEDLAGMTRSMTPPAKRKAVVVMAGDHGVVAEGVSRFPQEVTPQMVANFVNGGAGINALARTAGAEVLVVDMGVAGDLSPFVDAGKVISKRVAPGTANLMRGPAMTRAQAEAALTAGIELARERADDFDLFATGEMGIGNTTPSTAIVATLCDTPVAELTGRGTGIDDHHLRRKIEVIETALAANKPDPADGLDVLAKVGGFEIGGLAGLILGAASLRKPVIVDGFISTAAALVAWTLCPNCRDYMIAAHKSVEPGHLRMHELLGTRPLLDLNLRLGEGTGAALAMPLVDAAVAVLAEVATFEEAAVSEANE